jgi:hypothetical protein
LHDAAVPFDDGAASYPDRLDAVIKGVRHLLRAGCPASIPGSIAALAACAAVKVGDVMAGGEPPSPSGPTGSNVAVRPKTISRSANRKKVIDTYSQ